MNSKQSLKDLKLVNVKRSKLKRKINLINENDKPSKKKETSNVDKYFQDTFSTRNTSIGGSISYSLGCVPTQEQCELAAWGLPPIVLQKYHARGLTRMFPWQVECLANSKVLEERCNLVYSAPTSAGKTLVSEILLIKTVLELKKKAIFILPFVSVVREKMYYFADLLSDVGIKVEGFMGGNSPPGGFAATDVAIATIEKANSLVNKLMEEGNLNSLGAVVVDELHLLGDSHRGYLLELLLTKLKYMTLRDNNINIQIIAMSATLPNLGTLAQWLDAELYSTDFRPIPLKEYCKIENKIYDKELNLIRTLSTCPELTTMDCDHVIQLCMETVSSGHSVLIFCPSKNWCETLAQQIASSICQLGLVNNSLGEMLRQQLDQESIMEILEQLKRSPTGLDYILKKTVSFGVAFHHAGLTMDERDIVEGSFRSCAIRILVATSTLSSGVNLPARRVIVRSPMFAGKVIDTRSYKQMIGRAGRMGKDTEGESIITCKPNERKILESLLSASLEPIESCLKSSEPLIRALLEAVASEVVYTPSDLDRYTKCTLANFHKDKHLDDPAEEAIRFLIDHEFLLLQRKEEVDSRWVATGLGKACLAASMSPYDALFLFEGLQKARKCLVLDTELHIIYLVTPLTSGNQIPNIDWMSYMEIWKKLSESERKVGQLVGVEERYLMSAVRGFIRAGKSMNIHQRFFTALALHDLVREKSLNEVCRKFACNRGILQSLQQSAATFAGMVTQFCKQLKWDCMELLFGQFQTRLHFGVCRELLDLLRLPMLNGLRARSIFNDGITSVAELASANIFDVERALHKALPFESAKEQDGEHQSEAAKRNKMRTVFVTGKDGLTPQEAANLLVQEARNLIQNELGVKDVDWQKQERSTLVSNKTISQRLQSRNKETIPSPSLLKSSNVVKKSNPSPSFIVNSLDFQENFSPNEQSASKMKTLDKEAEIYSRSPSLFDDSLIIDTQEFNLFEKNIIDSLRISDFEDTATNKLEKKKSQQNLISIEGWINDSWNDTRVIEKKICHEKSEKNKMVFDSNDMIGPSQPVEKLQTPVRMKDKSRIKPKLKDILGRNLILAGDLSPGSIISNSDEDSPIRRIQTIQQNNTLIKLNKQNPLKIMKDQTIDWNTLNIINVSMNKQTFNQFKKEIMKPNHVSMALHCESYTNNNIGSKIVLRSSTKKRLKNSDRYVHENKQLCGCSFSWDKNIAYYMCFIDSPDSKVSIKEQMDLFQQLLMKNSLTITCYDSKEIFKWLYYFCKIIPNCEFSNPQVADWLLNGETFHDTYNSLVSKYFTEGTLINQRISQLYCYSGPGFSVDNQVHGEYRSAAESVLTLHTMNRLLEKLEKSNPLLLSIFKEIEMKTIKLLACMELTGFKIDFESLNKLSVVVDTEMQSLEKRAFALAGKSFNFSSSKEVAEVLGLYKGKKTSTNKAVLEQCDHPISKLIVSWRKLNITKTKIIYPILNLEQKDSRVHGNCLTRTLTGRISMHEPNLQNTPKDYYSEDKSFIISVRMAFVPNTGNVLVSADYCQLELRILAHFSKDPQLCKIMKQDGDIFTNITAKWNNTTEDKVTEEMRQRTKQLCYGMIYGMGTKTLAETLSVTELEAKEFLQTFMNTYPSIKKWLCKVVEDARRQGYVTTLMNRRRPLPGLNSDILVERSQAERQAVNTKIQGSAADLAKKAMIDIASKMKSLYPDSLTIIPSDEQSKPYLRSRSRDTQQRGGYLVLQLHDELLYEVNSMDFPQVAEIIKSCMEQVYQLAVPLPVKLKVGPAWGDLKDYKFPYR